MMTYLAAVVFPFLAIGSGVAVIRALLSFVRDIQREIRDTTQP